MFRGKTAEDEGARADQLFASKEFGAAKFAYERALAKAGDLSPEIARRWADQVGACCDALAESRFEEAKRLLASRARELAMTEIDSALETAKRPALVTSIREFKEGLEERDARIQATPSTPSDDDRYEMISSNWESGQRDEYERYDTRLRVALLALDAGDPSTARALLNELSSDHTEACYLHLELGRTHVAMEDDEAAKTHFTMFFDRLPAGEGGDARLAAHLELARILDESGDEAAAVAELERAIEQLDDDPRAYWALGRFLRTKGHADEAVEVLEALRAMMEEPNPDFRILEELGLAYADAGQAEEAISTFESIVRLFATRGQTDFPPESAIRLAELYEKAGRIERAADLYRSLSQGSDTTRHFQYHREAARLLLELGLMDEGRRMLKRASALEPDDPETGEWVQARLAELEPHSN